MKKIITILLLLTVIKPPRPDAEMEDIVITPSRIEKQPVKPRKVDIISLRN